MFTTGTQCPEGEEDMCEPHCDGELWVCLLIDDGGWIVSTNEEKEETDDEDEEPITEHLANAHPAAMSALLNAGIFKLRWVHDYQAVCFPPAEEDIISAASVSLRRLHSNYDIKKLANIMFIFLEEICDTKKR